jgi:hypothetical protein
MFNLGPMDIECDAPPYSVVKPLDRAVTSRIPGCGCVSSGARRPGRIGRSLLLGRLVGRWRSGNRGGRREGGRLQFALAPVTFASSVASLPGNMLFSTVQKSPCLFCERKRKHDREREPDPLVRFARDRNGRCCESRCGERQAAGSLATPTVESSSGRYM